jgi:hypothetical protein
MEDKILISTYAIHSNDPYKIKDLRSFLVDKKESLQHHITNLTGDKLISLLKMDCYFIEEKINTTIAYFQYVELDCVTKEKVMDKLKDLNILLIQHKEELLKLDFNENDYLSFKKEKKDAFDFELQSDIVEPKRKLLSNHKEIENEIKEFIKIDKSENNKDFDKKIKPELTFYDFIYNVVDKGKFAVDLKKEFINDSGIDFKIIICLLKDEGIFCYTAFAPFYRAIDYYFSGGINGIGSQSGLNDLYKHSAEEKKRYSDNIDAINNRLKGLIKTHKLKDL